MMNRSPWSRSLIAMRVLRCVAVLALLGWTIGTVDLRAQGFQVIVNRGNPVTRLTAEQVSQLFRKQTTSWETGATVVPVDLKEGTGVRGAFSRDILGKSVAAEKARWQRLVFSGRGVPPMELATDDEVVAFVAANLYAIGYVSSGRALGGSVKAVAVVSQ